MEPTYNFGQLIIILDRITEWEGLKIFMDIFMPEQGLFPVALQREVIKKVCMKERELDNIC